METDWKSCLLEVGRTDEREQKYRATTDLHTSHRCSSQWGKSDLPTSCTIASSLEKSASFKFISQPLSSARWIIWCTVSVPKTNWKSCCLLKTHQVKNTKSASNFAEEIYFVYVLFSYAERKKTPTLSHAYRILQPQQLSPNILMHPKVFFCF